MRTARKGPRAGQQFWGCAKYPACRGIVNAPGTEQPAAASLRASPSTRASIPRQVHLVSRIPDGRATVHQSTGVPREFLVRLSDSTDEESRRALCQWRMDVPPQDGAGLSAPPAWLTVARQMIRRGCTVPVSAKLAEKLRAVSGVGPAQSLAPDVDAAIAWNVNCGRNVGRSATVVDSDAERRFLRDVLPAVCGSNASDWCIPQLALGSLTNDAEDYLSQQRVDFLIAHPSGVRCVVEVDGRQHGDQPHAANDAARDAKLVEAGYSVVRVPTRDLADLSSDSLRQLRSVLQLLPDTTPSTSLARWMLMCRRAHQIQLAILELSGSLRTDLLEERVSVAVHGDLDPLLRECLDAVMEDLTEFVATIADARGDGESTPEFTTCPDRADLCVSFASMPEVRQTLTAFVSDVYLPFAASDPLPRTGPLPKGQADKAACTRLLDRVFGYQEFREGQFEAIQRAIAHQDSIVLLPTGSGKSVAFQLAGMLRAGLCLVVDPIVSLIEDQVDNLRSHGIDRVRYVTKDVQGDEREQVFSLLARGEFLFFYVAPERFQQTDFRDQLQVLTTHSAVSLVAIDEAHCVSEWGHDFRTSYLNLARNCRLFCATHGVSPPLMALTGTASRSVLRDVQRELGIPEFEAVITPTTFDRPELHYQVFRCRNEEKSARLRGVVEMLPSKFGHGSSDVYRRLQGARAFCGLVFCPYVNGDNGVVDVAQTLTHLLNIPVPFYAGGAPRGFDPSRWDQDKRKAAKAFKRGAAPLMVATKAFGMGIDKPNVRFTVHYNVPASIESFYQEAGRAGRDRGPAICTILCSDDHAERNSTFLSPSTPLEELRETYEDVPRGQDDDIRRALFFHLQTFSGVNAEIAEVRQVLKLLSPIDRAQAVEVPFGEDKGTREKAIHRLVVLGVVRDYVVEYKRQTFTVHLSGADKTAVAQCFHRYVAAYQRGRAAAATAKLAAGLEAQTLAAFIVDALRHLLDFVYDVVEKGRRIALSEMLRLCREDATDTTIRAGIVEYLGASQYTPLLEELKDADDAGMFAVGSILELVRSSIDAGEARSQTARMLESYPDHPGLLLTRAAIGSLCSVPTMRAIVEDARASVEMALTRYDISMHRALDAVRPLVQSIADSRPDAAQAIVTGAVAGCPDGRNAARYVIQTFPPVARRPAAAAMLRQVSLLCKEVSGVCP